MGIKRLHQLVAATEEQSGVALSNAALFTAANASVPVGSPVMELAQEPFDRSDINRESLSPLPALAGVTRGTASWNHELTGHVTAATVPPWFKFWEAAGHRQATMHEVQIGAITSGPFQHGEELQVSSTTFGLCIHDTYNGDTVVRYELVSGGTHPSSSDSITGATSGASATASANADQDQGFALIPNTIERVEFLLGTLTGSNAANDVYIGATNGGIFQAIGTPASATRVEFRQLEGFAAAGETLTNVTQTGTAPIDGTPAFAQTRSGSLSAALIEDGRFKQLKGMRGSVSIAGEIGQATICSYTMSGLVEATGSRGPVLGAPRVLRRPTSLLGVTVRIGDGTGLDQSDEHQPRLRSFSFDLGKETSIPDDMSETLGLYDAAHITSQSATGTLQLQVRPEASYDFLAAIQAGRLLRCRIDIGSSNGEAFRITTPAMLPTGESSGEANGFATFDLATRLSAGTMAGGDRDDAELVLSYKNP